MTRVQDAGSRPIRACPFRQDSRARACSVRAVPSSPRQSGRRATRPTDPTTLSDGLRHSRPRPGPVRGLAGDQAGAWPGYAARGRVRRGCKVPEKSHEASPRLLMLRIDAGRKDFFSRCLATFQMSRKRLGSPVSCADSRCKVPDLGKQSFPSFTLVPLDAAESPRKVPEGSPARAANVGAEADVPARGAEWSVGAWKDGGQDGPSVPVETPRSVPHAPGRLLQLRVPSPSPTATSKSPLSRPPRRIRQCGRPALTRRRSKPSPS